MWVCSKDKAKNGGGLHSGSLVGAGPGVGKSPAEEKSSSDDPIACACPRHLCCRTNPPLFIIMMCRLSQTVNSV